MDTETRSGVFFNVATGQEIIRPLTADEIASLIVKDGQETYPKDTETE